MPMVVSFVLINTAPKKEHEVYNTLLEINEISEVHALFGSFDLIVKLEMDEPSNMGKIINEKIRIVDGIIDTKTLNGK